MFMGGQDWDTVTLSKKRPGGGAGGNTSAAVNAARRAGQAVDSVAKQNHKSAGLAAGSGKAAFKLDNETEDFHHEKVSGDLKKAITQARTAKKMSQADLAKAINEKPQTIQAYEQGKAIPNPQILSKMSRILGVPLSKKGPKAGPKKK